MTCTITSNGGATSLSHSALRIVLGHGVLCAAVFPMSARFLKHGDTESQRSDGKETRGGNSKRHWTAPLRVLCASVFPRSARFLKHRDTEAQREEMAEGRWEESVGGAVTLAT